MTAQKKAAQLMSDWAFLQAYMRAGSLAQSDVLLGFFVEHYRGVMREHPDLDASPSTLRALVVAPPVPADAMEREKHGEVAGEILSYLLRCHVHHPEWAHLPSVIKAMAYLRELSGEPALGDEEGYAAWTRYRRVAALWLCKRHLIDAFRDPLLRQATLYAYKEVFQTSIDFAAQVMLESWLHRVIPDSESHFPPLKSKPRPWKGAADFPISKSLGALTQTEREQFERAAAGLVAPAPATFSALELELIHALDRNTLKGEAICARAKRAYDNPAKPALASLKRRGILVNEGKGYRLTAAYLHLLDR